MKLSIDGRFRNTARAMFLSSIAAAAFPAFSQEPIAASVSEPAPVVVPAEAAPVATVDTVPVAALPVAQKASKTESSVSVKLEKVEVTGSRIRRVDSETADLVQVLDRKQIQATGAATLGQLLQSVPSVQGTPQNSAVNNGGGDGAATANLRGLGSKRTLILLDGVRLNNNDLNAIPANMIERIEVLKEGAGAVYGTDAIGGVINFISRKRFQGTELLAAYGDTQEGGAATWDTELTLGGKIGDNGGFGIIGGSFNRQDEILSKNRDFSDAPTGYYYGTLSDNAFTSSRRPNGSFSGTGFAPAASTNVDCPVPLSGGTGTGGSRTLIDGRDGTQASDFRRFCGNFGPGYSDRYNYQQENYALTPSKRYSFFGSAQLPLTDDIKWSARGHYTNTRAQAQLAAEPFDNVTITGVFPPPTNPRITISADNVYNPFGRDITTFGKRTTDVGDRILSYNTETFQFRTGFEGKLLERFEWDVGANYGRDNQSNNNYGFLNFSQIYQQVGPSFFDAAGVARCGTADAIIPNCKPINVFGTTGNTLASLGTSTNFLTSSDESDLFANINGDVLDLPAGGLGLAAGVQYRTLHFNYQPDALAQAFGLSENNSQPTKGAYNVREAYLEASVPILKDMLLFKSLNFNLGVRRSNYSSFGNTTDYKYALEWKPYSDLLLRGTYSDIFRAPNTGELFQGPVQTSPTYADPCTGLDAATLAAHPNACANVAEGYDQPNTQANGNVIGNSQLNPETGFATDVGLVFSPSFYKPLSITVDYWRYTLKDAIDGVSLNTVLNGCFNNEASAFCGTAPNGQPYFIRDTDGNVANSQLPFVNSQGYETSGYDLSIKLDYPKVELGNLNFGRFSFGVDGTYLKKYVKNSFDPSSGTRTAQTSLAGEYDAQDTGDSFPRARLLGFLFWSKGPFSATVQDRFISNLKEGGVDVGITGAGFCSDEGGTYNTNFVNIDNGDGTTTPGACFHNTKHANYIDTSATYSLKSFNTDFTVGVNDVFSESAQQSLNANLAGAANPVYDVRGRNFYGRLKVTFK